MTTTPEEDKHYLPPVTKHGVRWINTGGWTKVFKLTSTDHSSYTNFENVKRRVIERRDYIMFEHPEDAVMFRLKHE